MKAPNKILTASVLLSLVALGATLYLYLQSSRIMSYLTVIQEKEEWQNTREELKENNRKLRSALKKRLYSEEEDDALQIIPSELILVEDDAKMPQEIVRLKPIHVQDKTSRLLSRSRIDILEENINRLKKSQRQNNALDRIDKHIEKLQYKMRLLNPTSRYRWTYEDERP